MVTHGIVFGHVISLNGIEVDKAKTDLIVNLPPPTSAKPLTNLSAQDVPFHFSDECHVAFVKLKEALTSAPVLHPPIWGNPFESMCDASDYAVGIILGQRVDKKPHVIYYVSHTLNDAQLNYTVTCLLYTSPSPRD